MVRWVGFYDTVGWTCCRTPYRQDALMGVFGRREKMKSVALRAGKRGVRGRRVLGGYGLYNGYGDWLAG